MQASRSYRPGKGRTQAVGDRQGPQRRAGPVLQQVLDVIAIGTVCVHRDARDGIERPGHLNAADGALLTGGDRVEQPVRREARPEDPSARA